MAKVNEASGPGGVHQPPPPLTFAVRVKPGTTRARVGGRHDGPFDFDSLLVAIEDEITDATDQG